MKITDYGYWTRYIDIQDGMIQIFYLKGHQYRPDLYSWWHHGIKVDKL